MVYRVQRDVEGIKMRFLMSSLNVYQKVIMSILAMILLTFGVQGIGYSQNIPMEADSSYIQIQKDFVRALWKLTEPKDYKEIYNQTIPSLLWITTDDGQASGVLIDKDQRTAVTNEHVTENHDSVNVFFPVRDKNGTLIYDRDFYEDESNRSILTLLGYATKGRVIAKESETDLALLCLDGIPATARAINCDILYDYEKMKQDYGVRILGNPGEGALWEVNPGFFQRLYNHPEVSVQLLLINANIKKGNSGGPVLNEGGRLIGIIAFSDRLQETLAIPLEYIDKLEDTLKKESVFSITNHTESKVSYQIKWTADSEWKDYSLEPTYYYPHSYPSTVPKDYPKIQFGYIGSDKNVSPKLYNLETNTIILGSGGRPNYNDTRKYHFKYDSQTKRLYLRDSEVSVFSVTSHTGLKVSYQIKWTENSAWKSYSLSPNPNRRNWYTDFMKFIGWWQPDPSPINRHWCPSTLVPKDYPKIQFASKSYNLETNTAILGYSDKPDYKDARKYQFDYDSQTKELALFVHRNNSN